MRECLGNAFACSDTGRASIYLFGGGLVEARDRGRAVVGREAVLGVFHLRERAREREREREGARESESESEREGGREGGKGRGV